MIKVIIVGGEHHNGLNLARIFGLNNLNVDAVVVGDKKSSFIAKSKFVNRVYFFNTEQKALDFILSHYSVEQNKPFIIPYSDAAALLLDKRLDEFKNFNCPSISGKSGAIADLMNKQQQYEFAVQHDIKMAHSSILKLKLYDDSSLCGFTLYPYILKPNISATGKKSDIQVCYTADELNNALRLFIDKGYDEVLVQEFLKVDYEALIVGVIYKNNPINDFVVNKVIRKWPNDTGCGTYNHLIADENIIQQCVSLLNIIKSIGYCGPIDVEVFVVDNKIYLNELNLRNSGGDYKSLSQAFYYPYWWCKDYLGEPYNNTYAISENIFSITEMADFNHVIDKRIKYRLWKKQFKQAQNHALYFKGDMKPYRFVMRRNRLKLIVKMLLPKRILQKVQKV